MQGHFTQGYDIHDNIFLLPMKSWITSQRIGKRMGLMGIKLDMKKVYDRLEWKFTQKCFIDLVSRINGPIGWWNV